MSCGARGTREHEIRTRRGTRSALNCSSRRSKVLMGTWRSRSLRRSAGWEVSRPDGRKVTLWRQRAEKEDRSKEIIYMMVSRITTYKLYFRLYMIFVDHTGDHIVDHHCACTTIVVVPNRWPNKCQRLFLAPPWRCQNIPKLDHHSSGYHSSDHFSHCPLECQGHLGYSKFFFKK